jgi:drug/metabolite transporter (DMT)-like permease
VSRRHLAALVGLSLIWGASFMLIKVAVRTLDPVTLVWLRVSLAAAVLVPIAVAVEGSGVVGQARRAAGRLTVLGVVNTAAPFLLLAWAETRMDSGLAAILQAATPLFTMLIALRVGDERTTGWRVAGVLVGFVGVSLLVGFPQGGSDELAAGAVVLCALCYAAGAVFSSHSLGGTSPLVIGAGSLVAAAVVTAPVGIAEWPASSAGPTAIAAVAAVGVVGTGAAYILYFALVRGAGPSSAVLVTYLVPGIALIYGYALLGEPLQPLAIVGLTSILCGVALASGMGRARLRAGAIPGTPAGARGEGGSAPLP